MGHKASCQCGQLRVTASDDPDFVVVCNCRACQKRTGAPFGEAAYFRKQVTAPSGRAQSWTRTADSGRELTNFFCPDCGTTLYWTLQMRPGHIGVAAGCFETPVPTPVRAIWTEEKHGWVNFPPDWPTFPRGTPEP